MKQTLLLLVSVVWLASCGDRTNKTTPPSDGTADTLSLSDAEFKEFVDSFEGKQISTFKAGELKAIGPKDTKEVVAIDKLTNSVAPICSIPTAIAGLNSGAGYEVYKFTSDASASAAAMGFTGSIGRKELLVIRDYVRYQIVDCGGTEKKFGIGLRMFIHVKSIKSKLTGSFANIAAAAQLDQGSATYTLKSLGFGMEGDMLAEELDGQGDYNVDNFGKIAITFNNVLKTLKSDNSQLKISPVELPN
jgi:hypothetical protein